MTERDALRVAVLLSGEGTSLENLFERIESGALDARIVAVISSKEHAGGLERAQRRGVPALAVPRKQYPDPGDFNDAIHAELDRHEVGLVACLGFLSPFETRGKFDGRAINVHPAIIPAFCGKGYYGRRVHEAVLASGATKRAQPSTSSTQSTTADRSSCKKKSQCAPMTPQKVSRNESKP